MRDESFQAQAEKPLGTDSYRTISKRSSECWLPIRHKKCFVLLCPIGEQHLLNSFREFVHDGYWLDHGLPVHAPKKCTQSGIFRFDINVTIQNTQKLKTLFQKYKLELTTGIHACVDHAFVNIREFKMPWQLTATKTSHEKWIHIFSVSIVIIPTRLLCQMQANSSGAGFLSTISKFIKRIVQSNYGLQQNFFQRHLVVGWLFNNILKIRQNRFGEIWEKLAIKIFNFHHRTPNFRKITNSDKTSDNCVLFFSRIFDRASLMYFG